MVMVDLSGASLTFTEDARGFFGDGDGEVPRLLGSSGEGVESAEAFFLCSENKITLFKCNILQNYFTFTIIIIVTIPSVFSCS